MKCFFSENIEYTDIIMDNSNKIIIFYHILLMFMNIV